MSYCRFGPESDVHCYKNEHFNYAVAVAGHRIVDTPMDDGRVMRQLKSRTNKIDLPHAATERNFCFAEHAYDFLIELRDLGYMVPDDGLALLKKEVPTQEPLPVNEIFEPGKGDSSQALVVSLTKDRGFVVTPNTHRPPNGVDVDSMNILELMECEYVPLNLPDGGRRFPAKTPTEAAEKLKELRSLGYEITDQYIDKIIHLGTSYEPS